MNFDINALEWIRKPAGFSITDEKIEIITKPHSDLWQRTYYHFRNDNAPMLQMTTDEQLFSFTVRTQFESKHRLEDEGFIKKLNRMITQDIDALHIGLCCVKDGVHCSGMQKMADEYAEKGIEVVWGTH